MANEHQDAVFVSCDFVPPSINHYYGHRGHMVFLTAEGKAFRRRMQKACRAKRKILGPVRVHVCVRWPDRRKHDIDNVFKALLDSVKDILFEDDDKIMQLVAEKRVGDKSRPAGFEMAVVPYTPAQAHPGSGSNTHSSSDTKV